jgi:REP element-mobilizing transposase RayT
MKRIYLLSTEHLEDGLWFRDEEDFKVAMNYVAIEAARHPEVVVLAFILMSNHVHFVLKGRREDVVAFVESFKQRYSLYYQKKYGVKEFLRRNGLDIKEIPYDNEAPEKVISYVQMNSVAANICAFCNQYPWGTGNLFFNATTPKGIKLGNMSDRARQKALHSNFTKLPEHWILGDDGYILPCCYVDVKAVEQLFRTPKRMQYFLHSSSKARKRLENTCLPAFRDQVILAAIPDLCQSLFQKDSFSALTEEEQSEFLRQLRYRFSADINQLARVCGLTYADAARIIEGV